MRSSEQNQQGTLSAAALAKTEPLLQQFEEWASQQFAPRTCEHYSADARGFAVWMVRAGLGFADVHLEDVQRYQGALFARKKLDGRALSPATIAVKIEAVRCLYRFFSARRARRAAASSRFCAGPISG